MNMENLSKFYIDGVWSQPNSGTTMPVLNPATERQVGVVALGTAADVDAGCGCGQPSLCQLFPNH